MNHILIFFVIYNYSWIHVKILIASFNNLTAKNHENILKIGRQYLASTKTFAFFNICGASRMYHDYISI